MCGQRGQEIGVVKKVLACGPGAALGRVENKRRSQSKKRGNDHAAGGDEEFYREILAVSVAQ